MKKKNVSIIVAKVIVIPYIIWIIIKMFKTLKTKALESTKTNRIHLTFHLLRHK